MRIALLNLQYDNNYGGNLQRYALVTILQRMEHDVTHLNLRFNYIKTPLMKQIKPICKKLINRIFHGKHSDFFPEHHAQKMYEKSCESTDVFYNKYIKHTDVIGSKRELGKYSDFDAFIVGSDQVWRKTIASIYGIDTFFFDYLSGNNNAKRIAYGASFGTDENELDSSDIERLTQLYNKFSSVSVREESGLDLLSQYKWISPQASWVLDPTLLLDKNDYINLIEQAQTKPIKGNMFCYILDKSKEKDQIIERESKNRDLIPFSISLDGSVIVEQWLRSFADSDFVITDSYHGLVFSIIFNKPYILIRNKFRGNARFDSIMKASGIATDDGSEINWDDVNQRLALMKSSSITWLNNALQIKK